MPRVARNIGIIALIALAVALVPGGGRAADVLVAAISLAFLGAMAWLGRRLYIDNRVTIWGLSPAQRALAYGAIALAFMALVATSRLWETGIGAVAWLALLAGAALTLAYVWRESRRYGI